MLNIVSFQRKAVFMKWSKNDIHAGWQIQVFNKGLMGRWSLPFKSTTTMIIAENISLTWQQMCWMVYLALTLYLGPCSSYNSMQSSHRIKKAQSRYSRKGQVARIISCFRNGFALKICTQLQLGGGSSMQLILKCSLHMVYIEAGISVNLRNHRNSSHHSWQHTFFI